MSKAGVWHLTGRFLHDQVTQGKQYQDRTWRPNLADKIALGGNQKSNRGTVANCISASKYKTEKIP